MSRLGAPGMETLAVIDFETTGMSPGQGARATEIAAVLVRDGRIVDRYQNLMKTGAYIPPFIEELTGISNAMTRGAPAADKVMCEVADFVGSHPLVAHNAAFDKKFWDAELARAGKIRQQEFTCSLLLARRIYPNAPNHKLGTLVRYAQVPMAGRYHRALADAEMTANLFLRMEEELIRRYRLGSVPHALWQAIQATPRHKLEACIERFRGND